MVPRNYSLDRSLTFTGSGLFSEDHPPRLRTSHDAAKTRDNLALSYQYFKEKHEKARDDEGRNKVYSVLYL